MKTLAIILILAFYLIAGYVLYNIGLETVKNYTEQMNRIIEIMPY